MCMTINNHFATSDSPLATFLIMQGIPIASIDYSKIRYEYVFTTELERIKALSSQYVSGLALVDPATYARVNRKLMRVVKHQVQWGDE